MRASIRSIAWKQGNIYKQQDTILLFKVPAFIRLHCLPSFSLFLSSSLWPLSLIKWVELALHSVCSVFFFLEPFGRPRLRFNWLAVGQQGSIKYEDNTNILLFKPIQNLNETKISQCKNIHVYFSCCSSWIYNSWFPVPKEGCFKKKQI